MGAFSFVLFAVVGWFAVSIALLNLRKLPISVRLIGSVAVAIGLIVLWLAVRPTSTISATAEVDKLVANGKPTIIHFYSEY